MKKINFLYVLSIIILGFSISSCEKNENENENENETKISRNFDNESHRFGENCMNCHSSGGEGEGVFSLAGSIYQADQSNKAPNGVIKFYSEPNGKGDLLKTVEVDANSNFYTTDNMDLSRDVFPVAVGKSGNMQFMTTPLSKGSCLSCHGNTTENLWID